MTATCYTQHHGTHKIKIEADTEGCLPEFAVVCVEDNQKDPTRFDPRLDWNAWTFSDIDPRIMKIRVEHFAGSVYIEGSLPFMMNRPKISAVWLEAMKRIY